MNSLINKIDIILSNEKIIIYIEVILIIYTIFIAPNMLHPSDPYTNDIISLFNNNIFKCLIFLISGYIIKINLRFGLFILIAYFVTNDIINRYLTSRQILKLVEKRSQYSIDLHTNKFQSTKSVSLNNKMVSLNNKTVSLNNKMISLDSKSNSNSNKKI